MKRNIPFLGLFFALAFAWSAGALAQKQCSTYAVGFYNLENLFDTCHDEGKNDYQFLPGGKYQWNGQKYTHKLHNMAQALADMAVTTLPQVGCAVIGVAEVENDKVLRDLCAQPELAARGYRYCHIEGPDQRGIDCALLYQPQLFRVDNVTLHPYVPTAAMDSTFATRGFLTVTGTLAGEPVAVIVCHLPSRFSESYYREVGAQQLKAVKDKLLKDNKKMKILVMGDMNDDPTDASMAVALQGRANTTEVKKGDMYNPWYNILTQQGTGTLMYNGAWNLFDQILLTPNLLGKPGKKNCRKLTYSRAEIQRMPYLFQAEGKYKGHTKRTTAGGQWLDGYSDHLPTVVYLQKIN